MKWLDVLKSNLKKKRSQADVAAQSTPAAAPARSDGSDDCGPLIAPPQGPRPALMHSDTDSDCDEMPSRPKRRSVSVDLYGAHADAALRGTERHGAVERRASVDVTAAALQRRASVERRASLEQWQETRRQRNSMDSHASTISTDKLTICKAAGTTIVNKTYVTIKHLGSGTFGRVMLCFNVYDHRLYAIKFCRKSQFAQLTSRHGSSGRLRRAGASANVLASPNSSLAMASGAAAWAAASGGGNACGPPLPRGAAAGNGAQGVNGGPLPPPGPPTCPARNGSGVFASAGAADGAGVATANGCGGTGNGVLNGFGRNGSFSAPGAAGWDSAAVNGRMRTHNAFQQQQSQQQQLQAAFAGACDSSGGGGVATGTFSMPGAPHRWGSQSSSAAAAAAGGDATMRDLHDDDAPPPPPPPPPPAPLPPLPDASSNGCGWAGSANGCFAAAPAGSCGPLDSVGSQAAPPGATRPSFLASPAVGAGGPLNHMGSALSGGPGLSGSGGSVFQEALARFHTEEVVKEIAILKKLSHPNIVNLVEVIDDPTTDGLLLVMEYVEGGTLQPREAGPGRWRPLPEGVIWKYVRQILAGLDYLHANRVVHGDLKPANLLLDSNSRRVKIADFGSSIITGGGERGGGGRPAGGGAGFSTPAFRSPESLISGYQPSFEMDMWALGVCIYIWLFGELPFNGAAPFIIYDKIRSQDLHIPLRRPSSDAEAPSRELLDLISKLLSKDVLSRLDITGAMRHPWVTQGGIAPLRSLTAGEAITAGQTQQLPAVRPSQEEIEGAIRLADAPLRERVDAVFSERIYADGEVLVAPGDPADTLFLLAAGEVDILAPPLAGGAGAAEPLISGLELDGFVGCGDLAEAEGEADGGGVDGLLVATEVVSPDAGDAAAASVALLGEVVVRHSQPLPLPLSLPSSPGSQQQQQQQQQQQLLLQQSSEEQPTLKGGANPAALMVTAAVPGGAAPAAAAADGATAAAGVWDDNRRLLAVKGPGDSLGLPSLMRNRSMLREHKWRVFCRARGEVTAFTARVSDLQALAARHPEVEPTVAQIATQQETDLAVAEAMRRLRLYGAATAGGGNGGGSLPMHTSSGSGLGRLSVNGQVNGTLQRPEPISMRTT